MGNNTRTALEAIAEALNTGADDVVMVFTVIIAVVLLLVVIASIMRIRNRNRTKKLSEHSYQKLIRKYNLTILELDMLEELAGTLIDHDKKYKLLVDAGTFRRAAHKLGELPDDTRKILASLEEKTGFASGTENPDLLSTRSFKRGMRFFLALTIDDVFEAEVYSVSDADIMLKTDKSISLETDEEITIFSFTAHGIITYTTKIIKTRAGIISAAHAEENGRQRRNTRLPINITLKVDKETTENIESLILQLNGPEAVIRDSSDRFTTGDELEFSPPWQNGIKVKAAVKKTAAEKKMALISFSAE